MLASHSLQQRIQRSAHRGGISARSIHVPSCLARRRSVVSRAAAEGVLYACVFFGIGSQLYLVQCCYNVHSIVQLLLPVAIWIPLVRTREATVLGPQGAE